MCAREELAIEHRYRRSRSAREDVIVAAQEAGAVWVDGRENATPTLRIVARGHRSIRSSAHTVLSRIRSHDLSVPLSYKEIANLDRNTPTTRAVLNECRTSRTRRQPVTLTSPVAFVVAVSITQKRRLRNHPYE